jgi:hypothetical protein
VTSRSTRPRAGGHPTGVNGDWGDAVEEVAPTVLILGGFLMSPPFYGPMRRRLLERGAAAVVTDRIWTPDWVLAGPRGLGSILRRAEGSLAQSAAASAASARSRGAPILVVGHSSGGIVARLLTSDVPYAGRTLRHAPEIGAVVTIGTPHYSEATGFLGRTMVARGGRFANRVVPAGTHGPRVGFVSVGSRAVIGRPDGDGRERVAYRVYRTFLPGLSDARIEGDGVVSLKSALLAGTTQVVLEGIVHGQGGGQPWYGTDPALDRWWPVAVDAWRDALRARVAAH